MTQINSQESDFEKGLKALFNLMIPPSQLFKKPGGAEVGFEKTMGALDRAWVDIGLAKLNSESIATYSKNFYDINAWEQLHLVGILNSVLRPFFNRLNKNLVEYYYQCPEVTKSIGLREGPPFPEGYRVDEGDLALLESVYEKEPIYRPIDIPAK